MNGKLTLRVDCPECGHPVDEWCDCPQCGWYDDDAWEYNLVRNLPPDLRALVDGLAGGDR